MFTKDFDESLLDSSRSEKPNSKVSKNKIYGLGFIMVALVALFLFYMNSAEDISGLGISQVLLNTGQNSILAHVSLDKPIYKPKDTIFAEVYLIDAKTKTPYTGD